MRVETAATPGGLQALAPWLIKESLADNERRGRARRLHDGNQTSLAALAHWWIERQRQPVIVLDNRKRILLINRAGLRFVESVKSLALSDDRLVFKLPRMLDAVNGALAQGRGSHSVSLRINGRSAALDINVMTTADNTLLIATVTSDQPALPDFDALRGMYNVTRAEYQIAVGILDGLSLPEIARQRDASVNTVKTQAKQLFQKCRVHSQVELVRKLGQLQLAL